VVTVTVTVLITAVSICRHYYSDGVCLLLQDLVRQCVCVFITAVPITNLFARGGMEDMCYERLRAEADVN
jgi:hypothetical protein